MAEVIGYCRFCGQSMMIESENKDDQELINYEVSKHCLCDGARLERSREQQKMITEVNLDEVVGEINQDIADIMKMFIQEMQEGRANAVTLKLANDITVSMKYNSKGELILKKEQKKGTVVSA